MTVCVHLDFHIVYKRYATLKQTKTISKEVDKWFQMIRSITLT